MIYYSPEDPAFENIKDKLKPTICKSCYADGDRTYGHCEQCLKNQAYNKEYCETHLFTTGTWLGDYHTGGSYHTMKYVPYRKNNEHPYLYYGFELEVGFDEDQLRVNYYDEDYGEDECEISSDCQEMLEEFEKATQGLFASKERDGSVYNGIEFVSRPMPYSTIIDPDTIKKLEKGLEVLKNWGAFVDQPYKHGMHVHISRKFFDFDENGTRVCDARDKAYQDIDWLFQFYQPELEKIAGREYYDYCQSKMAKLKSQYRILDDGVRDDGLWKIKLQGTVVKGGNMADGDHHSAVTLSGKTIEGRIFKSTLDINHVIGNIEVMRNFAHAVRSGEIVGKSLNDILHTKDNLYLDKVLDEIRKQCFKTKTEFNLDKVVEEEMEIK